ncbi:MAG: hypothetical protein ACI8R4_001609 [Paracoccaceae bacterium]|jgi:hypothetical protein
MSGDRSLWVYPWDLYDLGVADTAARMDEIGINMFSLATSYHAGRFLQPGNPRRRVYFPEDGTVYYCPSTALWQGQEITPQMAKIVDSEGDMLAALIDHREKGGPKVSCWTVCLHNTRLGMLHPGHVMRTAHGDAHLYGLCPSSDAVRTYLTTMIHEISHQYQPDRIELESPDFMGFSHGFHHEKDGLGLLPEDDFLLGVCFCPHCMTRAETAGVPVKDARLAVVGILDAAMARELPNPQFPDIITKGIDVFADLPELYAYLQWRITSVTTLIGEIKSVTHSGTNLLLIDVERSWAGGIDLPQLVPHLDGILHCAYFTPPDQIAPLMERTRAVLGPDRLLIAGFQLFHPTVLDRADLGTRVAQAMQAADGVNFYNLGLVPPARLDWIRTAV